MLVVRLQDPRFGLDDLSQRPERDALAVGQAAAVTPGDEIGPVVEGGAELGDEAALSDSGLADDGDELHGRLTLGAEERLEQERALVLPADERRLGRGLGLTDATAGMERAPDRDRLGLALGLDGLQRLEGDRVLGGAHRRLVDDHRTDRGGTLQTGGRVHDVAGDDSFTTLGARAECDDGLAGRHGATHSDIEPLRAQLLDRLQDPERRTHRPLGVVLVGDRARRRRPSPRRR